MEKKDYTSKMRWLEGKVCRAKGWEVWVWEELGLRLQS